MSQTQQMLQAKKSLNNPSIITYFHLGDGTIIIVSIVLSDGKTHVFGNGIGTIVPMNRIAWKKESQTPVENQKQYTIRFENDTWNVIFGETSVHTFDEIFGLPAGTICFEKVSFQQFKYVPTAVDGTTTEFTRLLVQLVSAYPDQFCLEDPKKQKTANVEGKKVRIPQSIFHLLILLLIRFGVSTYSFVYHLINCSKGIFRGDADVYVPNLEQANRIITILTTMLGFEKLKPKQENGKPQPAKSNDLTFTLSLDTLSEHLNIRPEELIGMFNLPEGSDPTNYYIELEIKIATDFQKAYESNCLGYFIGLLLSHFLKISISGVSLSLSKERKISIDVCSFDEFLKKLGIVLDGIMTAQDFIDRLLRSTLISELIVVKDFLRVFISIMGEEKTMHTSKSLREYLHLLLCGLKDRFPDRFSSLETELVQEYVPDEKSGQMIHTWYVKLFVLNSKSQRFEVQMEEGKLWIDDGGKKWFISTGADGNSLIFSETPLKTDSGKKPLPLSVKQCSELYRLSKEEYFDCLKELNHPQIKKFIDALECRSEVDSHVSGVLKKICNQLTIPLYPLSRKKKDSMNGKVYGELMKCSQDVPDVFSQFQKFCVDGFDIVQNLNEIFHDYSSQNCALSQELTPEEHKQKREENYATAILKIEEPCLELVRQWTSFHNSDVNWTYDETGFFHIPSQTYHGMLSDSRPYYLGTSVLIEEASSVSLPSKGKKQKGQPEGEPAPEEKPQGKPVHVFMDGKSGEVFTMLIAE